jgi:LysM repeat protein
MKDDPELQINDARSDNATHSTKQRRTRSSSNKLLPLLMGILIVLIFAGGILYFLSKQRSTGREGSFLQSRVNVLEQKIDGLEKQLLELQGKTKVSGPDPALLQRMDALAQKVEALEKQKQPIAQSKPKSSAPSKSAVSSGKQYHTVQRGETLYRISKKYRISVEKLQKLNHLSADQRLRTGQRLLVSPGH